MEAKACIVGSMSAATTLNTKYYLTYLNTDSFMIHQLLNRSEIVNMVSHEKRVQVELHIDPGMNRVRSLQSRNYEILTAPVSTPVPRVGINPGGG